MGSHLVAWEPDKPFALGVGNINRNDRWVIAGSDHNPRPLGCDLLKKTD
jgi:hypothetical protein